MGDGITVLEVHKMLLVICFLEDKSSPLSSSSQGEALAQAFLVKQNRSTRT